MGFLDRFRGGATEMSLPAGSEMLIGAPAEQPPEALVQALREGSASHPEIRSAYLFQLMIMAEGEEPHLTLGVDFDEGATVGRIANDLGGRAIEILPDGEHLDVYPLPDDMLDSVAESVGPLSERPA